MEESYTLTWEDEGNVVQTEEVITMENEIIATEEEEYVTGEQYEPEFETEEIIDDVGIIEEEIIEDDNIQTEQEITLETEQPGEEEFMYLSDENILIMNDANDTEAYTQDDLMQVTEEVITEQWDEACPEEIIIGSEEAVGSVDGQLMQDEDIPLPTDQDSYTAARPYPCDFCSKRFRKKANLMNHMFAHQTDRPHDCNLCGVRYMRKSDLLNHLKNHAVAPDSAPLEDDEIFDEQNFDAERRSGNYTRRKRKRVARDDYFNEMFSAEPETSEDRLNDSSSNIEYYTSGDTEIRYPVTDPRKPFVCQHCGVGFAREKALASHARIHGGDSPFECQKCGEMFWDMGLMQEHAKIKHGEIEDFDYDDDEDYSDSEQGTRYGTFYCSSCGLSFHRQDNLKRHQRIHIKEEYVNEQEFGHMCNVCGECFNEALDLLAHAEVHARGSEHRCMMCGEICMDESSLANHVQSYHKNLPPHTCSLCGRTCRDSRALFKHSWEHSKEKSFACNQCTKTFHNKARLKRHMQSHRNKVVTCDICGEDFPDGRTLMNHRHSHTNISGRQFPCRECGKTFGSRSSQQIHIRIHTGERPYGCRFCWKAFADGGTLRKHERIHTGEKPYACAVCPRAFNQRVVLREHIRSHHSGPDPKFSQSTTPYCCSVCSDRFVASQDLIVHLIQHCDMNTALKRQPQVGPRKYKRRRKLKPHELELMSAGSMTSFNITGETINPSDVDEDGERRRKSRRGIRKTSVVNTSPKLSANESVEEIYEAINVIENSETIAAASKSPTSKNKLKKTKTDSVSVPSRPKMIHTQKTRVAVETGEDGRIRHKTKTLVTRTQPAEIKSAIGERIRPRTKNVSYHVLAPDKYTLATFPTNETEEAVQSVLKETITEYPGNGEFLTEEIIEETPDVAAEQIVETENPVPVSIVEVRTRRNSSRSSKNVIGPGSKVRLVKEGMIISKMKRNSESHVEPETILPDIQSTEINIKQEHYSHFTRSIKSEQRSRDSEESYNEYQNIEDNVNEPIDNPSAQYNNTHIKHEILDPSALHELAEVSLQHAQNSANYYKCEMCDEVFSDRAQLLIHVPVHI